MILLDRLPALALALPRLQVAVLVAVPVLDLMMTCP
jgi:hypothetical protein